MLVWMAFVITILCSVYCGKILQFDRKETGNKMRKVPRRDLVNNTSSPLSEGNQSEKIQTVGVYLGAEMHKVPVISYV